MNKKKKILEETFIPGFEESIANMPEDSRIFVDKSMEVSDYIFFLMESKEMKQKDLADKLGKTEAEVSKWLAGMHNFTLRSLAKLEAALETTIIEVPKVSPQVKITKQYSSVANGKVWNNKIDDVDYNHYTKVVYMKVGNSSEQTNEDKVAV